MGEKQGRHRKPRDDLALCHGECEPLEDRELPLPGLTFFI